MIKKIFLATLLVLLIAGGVLLFNYTKESYFQPLKEHDGRTNFLLLGVNGRGGSDADLTDTMLFVSLNHQTGKIVFLSFPRDIWVEDLQVKLNAVYHYGGINSVRKKIYEISGQSVDYYFLINFESFAKVVDLLGGVVVNVQRGFDDYRYPIAGREKDLCDGDPELACRYEHLRFEPGKQVLDGATALKYVRSRNAEGEEGTDFARSARQQQFLKGLKETLLQSRLYLRPKKAWVIWQAFWSEVITDFPAQTAGSLLRLSQKLNWGELKSGSLVELLINPKKHSSGQWVLEPKGDSWQEIRHYFQTLLN